MLRKRFRRETIIGFIVPFACVAVIGLALRIHTSITRKTSPVQSGTANTTKPANASAGATPTIGVQPSAADVAAANAAILAYCTSDLRQDSYCSLIANSNIAAPGFVASQITETGSFADGVTSSQGTALAKASGATWSVVWVGQGCVPQNVAKQYSVPNAFTICAS